MSTVATTELNLSTTLSSLFKEVYDDQLKKMVPDGAMLVKELKFSGVEASLGGKFVMPFILTREHGFTYASSDEDGFDLNGSIPVTVKRAELLGSQLVGQGRIGYEAAARASKGKAAFAEATELLIENMMESAAYRLELMFLYGQSGIGTVNANTAAATTFVISAASWAPAIWAGAENAKISIVSSDGATLRTAAGGVAISSIDFDTRTITVASAQTLTAGDLVYFGNAAAAGSVKECLGLNGIITKSSGNLFGVAVSTSPLWKGNSYSVGGALTVTHILKAAKLARDKGLKKAARLLVSPASWLTLVNPTMDPKDSAAVRKVDASYSAKKIEFGTEAVMIHGPQGQNIEVVSHPYIKEGEAFLVPMDSLRRVGTSDIDFKTPGMRDEDLFMHIHNQAAYEFRCYANQALFCDAPAHCVKLTGITNP